MEHFPEYYNCWSFEWYFCSWIHKEFFCYAYNIITNINTMTSTLVRYYIYKAGFWVLKYEKGKPLVNLVDNMVKLGSLYRAGATPVIKDRLEFNHQVQERRLLAEERRDWERLSPDHTKLQVWGLSTCTMLSQLLLLRSLDISVYLYEATKI